MFPLYETLEKRVVTKYPKFNDENESELIQHLENQWKSATAVISMLDEKNSKILYAIIYHHYTITQNKASKKIPYNGKLFESGCGVLFTAKNLPIKLQLIILEYLDALRS